MRIVEWLRWGGIIVLGIILLVTAVPFALKNQTNLHLNHLAATQDTGCQQLGPELLFIQAHQLQGGGALKTDAPSANVADNDGAYVKLYSDATISFTHSLAPGSYYVQIYSKHARPGPVILQVMANKRPLGLLTYARDDDSWEGKCLFASAAHWSDAASFNLSIRFANDGGENGARDASIAWVKLFSAQIP